MSQENVEIVRRLIPEASIWSLRSLTRKRSRPLGSYLSPSCIPTSRLHHSGPNTAGRSWR